MMIQPFLLMLLFAFATPTRAATIVGADYAGANLTPANGDTLQGTFTNVGLFQVGAGTTAFVATGIPLVVYASTINIAGTLNGDARGKNGGSGGGINTSGFAGDGGCGSPDLCSGGNGSGAGGAYDGVNRSGGGGGGAYGGSAGVGAGTLGGTGGAVYGSTGMASGAPISVNDAFMGSGGGGGAGNARLSGASGGAGGGMIYLEASSITISGLVTVNGLKPSAATDSSAVGSHPGGGGGGAGGTVLLRAVQAFALNGSTIQANGGNGGDVTQLFAATIDPGGGASGGRIKLFYRVANSFSVVLSTAAGQPGGTGATGTGSIDATAPQAGSSGTISQGIIAAAPTGLSVTSVYVSSIAWSWTATADWGNAPAINRYSLYPSTVTAPFPPAQSTASATNVTEQNLSPNATYYRFVTATTDWGNSAPSSAASTHTLANMPGTAAAAFTSMANTSLTFNWTAGSPANPSYTLYQVDRSTVAALASAVQTNYVTTVSSSPSGLTPNTTYYLRLRAINADNVATSTTPVFSTATLCTDPSAAAAAAVFITSATFSWATGANPAYTAYSAQISTDNFFTLVASSVTANSSAMFSGLSPGIQYFFRVAATNLNGVTSNYSTVISTTLGILTSNSSTPPSIPGGLAPDRRFSYDGFATFTWGAAQCPIGILDYFLNIGSSPGATDFFSGFVGNTLTYAAGGLQNGKTYYAQVRARSNAGVFSDFSSASPGVNVYIPSQAPIASKPYNWPNPFDPQQGATTVGFFLDGAATVQLRIFTLQGELVHEESRDFSAGGNQVWPWNGANDAGRTVTPGGYIGVLTKKYGGRTETQKFKLAVLY